MHNAGRDYPPRNHVFATLRSRRLLYVPMLFLAAFFFAPILFMVVSSFKSDPEIFADLGRGGDAFLPVGHLSLDNYRGVFQLVPVGRFMANTAAISVATVVLGLIVNSMLAFALARMRWRGRPLILAIVIAALIVPFEAIAIPLLYEMTKLPTVAFQNGHPVISQNWLNTYYVQILPFVANPFSVFLFYYYFGTVPRALDEAARIDGAGWFTIYRRILVPNARPAFASVAILTFLASWNQYLWPLMAVQDQNLRPVNVGLDYFFQNFSTAWGELMAYATLIVVPVLVVFVIFQRAFIASVAATGIKG